MCVKFKDKSFNQFPDETNPVKRMIRFCWDGIDDTKKDIALNKLDKWENTPEYLTVKIGEEPCLVYTDGRIISVNTGEPYPVKFYHKWNVNLIPALGNIQKAKFMLFTWRKIVPQKSDIRNAYLTRFPNEYDLLSEKEWDKIIIIGRTNGNRLCDSLTNLSYMVRSQRQYVSEIDGKGRAKNNATQMVSMMAFYYKLVEKYGINNVDTVVLARMFNLSDNTTNWPYLVGNKKTFFWANVPPKEELLEMSIPRNWWTQYEQGFKIREEERERANYGC